MRILIDNSNLFAGGGIQVATSFLNDLLLIEDDNEYYVVQSKSSSKQLETSKFDDRFVFFSLSDGCVDSLKSRIREVREIENKVRPNVIFTVFGPSYHKSSFPKVVGFAIPHILYPHSPFFSKISFSERLKVRVISTVKSFFFRRHSNALVFESDDAKKICQKKYNEKIPGYTVSNTLNSVFSDSSVWKELEIVKSKFDILYLTANYAHKNLDIIPSIIDSLLRGDKNLDFKFHLSIKKEELGFDDKYDKYINYLGKVDINQVPMLYQQMDMLFMPTLLEVFSTSYLEAMASNIPIVASDMSFARDVCRDSALYCRPLDVDDYAKKILEIYDNNRLRENLVAKGRENLKRFGSSMDRTIKYLEILKKHAI